MDKGFKVLEGLVILCVAAYVIAIIAPPLILDIIWINRVKSGKSKKFGALGIISIIVTIGGILNLPFLSEMIGGLIGRKQSH